MGNGIGKPNLEAWKTKIFKKLEAGKTKLRFFKKLEAVE